jgi:hypothetical protein
MTRDEAKKIALDSINKEIELRVEDSIFAMSPMRGKNSWTLREAKESIMEDKCLENTDCNLIDDTLKFYKWKKELEKM